MKRVLRHCFRRFSITVALCLLGATTASAVIYQVVIDPAKTVRTADARWLGINTAIWDSNFDTAVTTVLLNEMGGRFLRYPGGSRADDYHWSSNKTGSDGITWTTSPSKFAHVATNIGAQVIITANYGTGTPEEAADWVRSSNITNHWAYRYWEIGNEIYGSWEMDSNSVPHDPYTYALRATNYIHQMKAVDPTIKIGVVVVAGEDSYVNNTSHPVVNPRTGLTHNGWTPVLLKTLASAGVQPDFLSYHYYPEYNSDNDATLLQQTSNWAADAADLRQQLTDYMGSTSTNIELLCTENNADSGNQGKQSTSLVNGLYLASSLAEISKTEFNGFVWWDLRNGSDTTGDFSSSLYGWRTFGDLGIINGTATRLPTFYALKLMQFFVQPGDTVLNATASIPLLSTYATKKADGALTLLAINRSPSNTIPVQVVVTNFTPWTNATVRSYGIPQDGAARTNATLALQNIATNSVAVSGQFIYSFAPYSLTLFTFSPDGAKFNSVNAGPSGFAFQLQGQPNGKYVVQSSTDFTAWLTVSTNTATNGIVAVTNSTATSPLNFWRAFWTP